MDKKIILGVIVAIVAIGTVIFTAVSFKPVSTTPEAEKILTGTISPKGTAPFPVGSLIEIEIRDISRSDAPFEIVAQTSIVTDEEKKSAPFELNYKSSDIYPNRVYIVFARVTEGPELKWITDSSVLFMKDNVPIDTVDLVLSTARSDKGKVQPADLDGKTFRIVSLNGKEIYEGIAYKFNFKENTVYTKICNSMFGGFTLINDTIKSNMTTTLMFCERPSNMMEIEDVVSDLFSKGANASLSQDTLTLSREENILVLEEVQE